MKSSGLQKRPQSVRTVGVSAHQQQTQWHKLMRTCNHRRSFHNRIFAGRSESTRKSVLNKLRSSCRLDSSRQTTRQGRLKRSLKKRTSACTTRIDSHDNTRLQKSISMGARCSKMERRSPNDTPVVSPSYIYNNAKIMYPLMIFDGSLRMRGTIQEQVLLNFRMHWLIIATRLSVTARFCATCTKRGSWLKLCISSQFSAFPRSWLTNGPSLWKSFCSSEAVPFVLGSTWMSLVSTTRLCRAVLGDKLDALIHCSAGLSSGQYGGL